MRRHIRTCIFLTLFVSTLLLTGCAATGPKPIEMKAELDRIPANKGRIYFYRLGNLAGGAVQPNISLNGSVVGESKPGGFFHVDVDPGTHEATARTEVAANVVLTIRDGEARYVRSSIKMGIMVGRIEFALVDSGEGQFEIRDLSFTGSNGLAGSPSAIAPPATPSPSDTDRRPATKPVTLDDLDALLPKK